MTQLCESKEKCKEPTPYWNEEELECQSCPEDKVWNKEDKECISKCETDEKYNFEKK